MQVFIRVHPHLTPHLPALSRWVKQFPACLGREKHGKQLKSKHLGTHDLLWDHQGKSGGIKFQIVGSLPRRANLAMGGTEGRDMEGQFKEERTP